MMCERFSKPKRFYIKGMDYCGSGRSNDQRFEDIRKRKSYPCQTLTALENVGVPQPFKDLSVTTKSTIVVK